MKSVLIFMALLAGAMIFFFGVVAGKKWYENPPYPGEYQIILEQDSTYVFDGKRFVGALPFDSTQAFDKLMLFDNQ